MRSIHVHVDLEGVIHQVGLLRIHQGRDGESALFEYSRGWLSSPISFALDPALKLTEGKHQGEKGKTLFGCIGDSAPDRWGRVLMQRREARQARAENRSPRTLLDSDYLLKVDDYARQGALRFSEDPEPEEDSFLAPGGSIRIPALIHLRRLLDAADRVLAKKEQDQDIKDLVAPGSSLGGARPKASILDTDGSLCIAKFPSRHDDWDVELWEYLSFTMARRAGIPTPTVRLEKVAEKNVLILDRFDRRGKERIPFLSAMSMLGYTDGDHGSYPEIAEALVEHGAATRDDKKDLFRRMVFNIMISNVDDHLRNHGFLYAGKSGWRLSPVYDLEPTPTQVKARVLHTRIDPYDGTASLDLAYSVSEYFGLSLDQARTIANEVAKATKDWRREAQKLGAQKEEIEFMSSAFEHEELTQALRAQAVSSPGVNAGQEAEEDSPTPTAS